MQVTYLIHYGNNRVQLQALVIAPILSLSTRFYLILDVYLLHVMYEEFSSASSKFKYSLFSFQLIY